MRKLNVKNKIFIAIFSLIVISMVVFIVFAVAHATKNAKKVYDISSNSAVFDSETNLIDTSKGGQIAKRWNDTYYYLDNNDVSYEIGYTPVVYEKATEEIHIFGPNYQVQPEGSIIENNDVVKLNDLSKTNFYKLSDRVYLVVSPEIYNKDKSIYASKYLIVYIDKKGNASFLNDSINLKTINPTTLTFDIYTFDIANESLVINDKAIDLKAINGSTNEYVPKKEVPDVDINIKDFAQQYNDLVNSFQQYIDESSAVIGANNKVINSLNFIITDSTQNKDDEETTEKDEDDKKDEDKDENNGGLNLTRITKKASLRGAVSYPTHIDVSYSISDVADQFQVVYLIVTGTIDGEKTTEKIILDKYSTGYRINGLTPRYEYTISLGYVEKNKDITGNEVPTDSLEDVINVRTTKADLSLEIIKVAKGYVHFNFKMTKNYALDSANIALYADGIYTNSVPISQVDALSKDGFTSKLKLPEASIIEIKVEDAKYSGKAVKLNVKKKFTY